MVAHIRAVTFAGVEVVDIAVRVQVVTLADLKGAEVVRYSQMADALIYRWMLPRQ